MERPGLELLDLAVRQLGDIADELVFVGGATLGLLITDPAVSAPRTTDDVDAIVAVATPVEYSLLCERLIEAGFSPTMDVDCRWRKSAVILDVMPTDPNVLGFSNDWYGSAVQFARTAKVVDREIRHIDAPHFLATKLCAFEGRGGGDFQMSHDMEDFVRVIHGHQHIVRECAEANERLRHFLADRLSAFMRNDRFHFSLEGHLGVEGPGQVPIVLRRISEIVGGAS